jgi:hypothetical protein
VPYGIKHLWNFKTPKIFWPRRKAKTIMYDNNNNVFVDVQLTIAQHHHWRTTTLLEKKLPNGGTMWLIQLHAEKQEKKDKER